ncbi:hypothetical protein MBLNU459_g7977t3 [Dothideomycetes sp. NU459]
MFRSAARSTLNQAAPLRAFSKTAPSRRFLSTAPPHQKSRSWKNSAVRWGLAGTLVYYYNTSNVFAEEPALTVYAPPKTPVDAEQLPTLEAISAQRQARAEAQARVQAEAAAAQAASGSATVDAQIPSADVAAPGSPDELEEEASQQGAFNEETGEINWDCPCLGGMAHGPCGDQFREAFSCFVFSKEEPKGVECIDKFKNMQNCFREHPDIYGSELDEEETEDALNGSAIVASDETSQPEAPSLQALGEGNPKAEKVGGQNTADEAQAKRERAVAARDQVKSEHGAVSEADEMVPKAWHDSTDAESKSEK